MSKIKTTDEPVPLRVLILEDNPVDAELVEHELHRAKIDFTSRLVEGKREFNKALADFQPQVILSDFKLPLFDGLAALEIARVQAPEIPFIFVSGSIGEEKAIALLSQGASDYIFKDNLARLVPAVKRVIEESRLRAEKKITEGELQRHAEELRILSEAADRFVHINDLDEIYRYLSDVIRTISGADYLLLSLYDQERQGLQPKVLDGIAPFQELLLRKLGRAPEETILLLKDMSPAEFADFVSRKLLPIHAGLFTLTDRTTPRSVCRAIEKTMGITALYSMGFSWENQLFGGLALAFKKGKELRNSHTIEALVNLAAVAIKRLLAEKSLRESKDHLLQSEEYYRTLVQTSPDAIIIVDAGGRVTFCSDKTMDIFGIPPGNDIIGVSIFDFVEPGEISRVQERMIEIISGRSRPEIREYRLLRQDHRSFWGEVSSAPLHDGKGRDIGLLLVCRDISARKQSEAALQESEVKYRLIADNTAETITVLDQDLRFTYISPSIFKLRGFTVEEALKQTLEETLTRDSLARIRDVFQEEMALEMSGTADPKRNRSLELQEFCKDGSIVWVENSLAFLRDSQGKPIGFLAVSKDISERKRAEREQRKLLDIIEMSLNEIYLFDSATLRFEYVNQGALRNIGYTLAEMKELTPLAIKPRYGEAEFRELLQPLISGEKDSLLCKTIHQRKDGSQYPVEIHLQLFKQENKSVFFAVINDISERMRVEEQIRYQAGLLLNVSDAIISTDKNNIIQIWNHAAERIYGWKKEEAAGRSFHDLIRPEYRYQRREEVVETLEREGFWSGELIHHLHDGRQIPVQSSISILKDATGHATGTVSVNHDISERKAAEEQIRASLKEKEVLLQEIHHRVKNNLQIISGLLTLQADQAAGRTLAEIFRESQDRIRSIALIHEKLYRSHNLAEIAFDEYLRALTENLFISHSVASGHIAAKFEMEPMLFTIEKAIPLGLIVNELVTNALKHAFPGGRTGEIRIGLRFSKEARFVGVKTESGTLYRSTLCELTIADDGIGMPTDRVSETEGKLGMKLVSMLTQQLQAELTVKSGPGTEFRLVFAGSPLTMNSNKTPAQEGA